MKLQLIDDAKAADVLDFPAVMETIEQAFIDMSRGSATIVPRHRTRAEGVVLSTMGGLWKRHRVAGIKAYTTVEGQFSFLISLFDLDRNVPWAVLEANEITRFRTAAMATMVARRCAHPQARKLAIVGAGVQGRSIAEALCQSFQFEQVCAADPAVGAGALAGLSSAIGLDVRHCTAEEAVRDADIVVTASRCKVPVIDGKWLKPGCFVAAFGTSLPDGTEIDGETMRRSGRVIVEWKPQSMVEAGEIVLCTAQGSLAPGKVHDLGELLRGDQIWRGNADEIVLFKSVGVGLADVATAWLAATRLHFPNVPVLVAAQ